MVREIKILKNYKISGKVTSNTKTCHQKVIPRNTRKICIKDRKCDLFCPFYLVIVFFVCFISSTLMFYLIKSSTFCFSCVIYNPSVCLVICFFSLMWLFLIRTMWQFYKMFSISHLLLSLFVLFCSLFLAFLIILLHYPLHYRYFCCMHKLLH